jgi:hypothetical protein
VQAIRSDLALYLAREDWERTRLFGSQYKRLVNDLLEYRKIRLKVKVMKAGAWGSAKWLKPNKFDMWKSKRA